MSRRGSRVRISRGREREDGGRPHLLAVPPPSQRDARSLRFCDVFHSREGTLKTQTAGRMIQVTGQASRNLRRVREALERLPNPKAAAVAWLGRLAKQAHPPPRRPPCRLPASLPARRRRPCLHCSRQNRAASFVARSRLPPPPEPGLERERERKRGKDRLAPSASPSIQTRRPDASVPTSCVVTLTRSPSEPRSGGGQAGGGSCRRKAEEAAAAAAGDAGGSGGHGRARVRPTDDRSPT